MKRFLFAAVCSFSLAGLVMAEELGATITKIDGSQVTLNWGSMGGLRGGMKTVEVASKVKVARGDRDPETKKWVAGEEIKAGLKAEDFRDVNAAKGIAVHITIDGDGPEKGKITQILVLDKKGNKNGSWAIRFQE